MFGQTKTITGTVTDEENHPLPSAIILIKGTTKGTITDFDGNYEINAKEGDTLQFSFVGFKTVEVKITQSNRINVMMTEEAIIDCFPSISDRIIVGLNSGLNYNTKGVYIKSNLYRLFNISLNTEIGLGYQTDFENNNKINIDFNFPNILYLRDFVNLGLDTNYTNINFEDTFDFKTYNINATINTWKFIDYNTNLSTGIGIGNFNDNSTKIGYTVGLKQRLPFNLEPHISSTFWNGFTEVKTGISWEPKRFNFQYEYHALDSYKEHTVSAGYLFYF